MMNYICMVDNLYSKWTKQMNNFNTTCCRGRTEYPLKYTYRCKQLGLWYQLARFHILFQFVRCKCDVHFCLFLPDKGKYIFRYY